MFSINMRLFKSTLLLLLAFFSSQVGCLPVLPSEESTTSSTTASPSTASPSTASPSTASSSTAIPPTALSPTVSTGDHYDQRQTGGDNYRIHVDGVVVVVAPVDDILAGDAALGANQSVVSFPGSMLQSMPKPEEETPSVENNPKLVSSPQPTPRSSLRLINLLVPFIRRFHPKV